MNDKNIYIQVGDEESLLFFLQAYGKTICLFAMQLCPDVYTVFPNVYCHQCMVYTPYDWMHMRSDVHPGSTDFYVGEFRKMVEDKPSACLNKRLGITDIVSIGGGRYTMHCPKEGTYIGLHFDEDNRLYSHVIYNSKANGFQQLAENTPKEIRHFALELRLSTQ